MAVFTFESLLEKTRIKIRNFESASFDHRTSKGVVYRLNFAAFYLVSEKMALKTSGAFEETLTNFALELLSLMMVLVVFS